jgi:hypothetical protein
MGYCFLPGDAMGDFALYRIAVRTIVLRDQPRAKLIEVGAGW